MANTFNCPTCNAPLDYDPGDDPVVRCPYCNNSVVVPEEIRRAGAAGAFPSVQATFGADLGALVGQAARFKEVKELVLAGKKIEAIKLYRQLTGLGLKESKDAIDALEAGKPLVITSVQSNVQVPTVFSEFQMQAMTAAMDGAEQQRRQDALNQVAQLMGEGKKIEAIKVYRQTFDVGLAEAKAAVERIEAGGFNDVARMALQPAYVRQVQPPVIRLSTLTSSNAATVQKAGCVASMFGVGLTLVILLATIVPILFALASKGGPLYGWWSRINPIAFGRVTMSFGGEGTGVGLFSDPRSLAVDADGNIYVAEYSGGRVQVFDPAGKFITQWNVGNSRTIIQSLAVSRSGMVFVVADSKLYRYSGQAGELLDELQYTEDDIFFNSFSSVATTADGGWVAVLGGENLVRYDAAGQTALKILAAVSAVSGDSELETRITLDGQGTIYALGIFNQSVFKFSKDGRFVTRWGSDGEEQGQFRAPNAIAVDGYSRVYVSDIKGVQVFASDGRYIGLIETDGVAFGLACDDQNNLYAVTNRNKVYKYQVSRP